MPDVTNINLVWFLEKKQNMFYNWTRKLILGRLGSTKFGVASNDRKFNIACNDGQVVQFIIACNYNYIKYSR